MEITKEQLANSVGSAFATTFWQVIKDEKPKKFTWDWFYESNKDEVRQKLILFFPKLEDGEEMDRLREIAVSSFKEACEKIRISNN